MPYSTKDPSRYPIYIDQIWQLAVENRKHTIPCGDKQEASKIRLQFNSFRSACRNSGHRFSTRYDTMEIIIRPTNKDKKEPQHPHTVIIRSLEDSEISQTLKASLKGSMFDLDVSIDITSTGNDLPDTSLPGEIKQGGKVF